MQKIWDLRQWFAIFIWDLTFGTWIFSPKDWDFEQVIRFDICPRLLTRLEVKVRLIGSSEGPDEVFRQSPENISSYKMLKNIVKYM